MARRSAYCHRTDTPGTHPNGSYLFTGFANAGVSPFALLNIAHNIGAGAWTWREWSKRLSAASPVASGYFSFRNGTGNGGIRTNAIDGTMFCEWASTPRPAVAAPPTLNVWKHLVFARDAFGVGKWFVDGVDVTVPGAVADSFVLTNLPLIVGANGNSDHVQPSYRTDVLLIAGTAWNAAEALADFQQKRYGDNPAILGFSGRKSYFPLDGRDVNGDLGSGSAVILDEDQGLRNEITGSELLAHADGTCVSTSFDSASVSNWVSAGVVATKHTLIITAGTGVTPGRYGIVTVASGALTLHKAPGAVGSDIEFSIVDEQNLNVWGAPLWVEDSPFTDPTADAGEDDAVCGQNPIQLAGTATSYSTVLWTTAGDGTFDDDTALDAIYTPGDEDYGNGSVVLTLAATGGGTTVEDTVTLTFSHPATVDAGGPYASTDGAPVGLLTATAANYVTVTWTTAGDGTFDNANALHPIYTPGANDISAGEVELTLTADPQAPCPPVEDTVTLTITRDTSVQPFPPELRVSMSMITTRRSIETRHPPFDKFLRLLGFTRSDLRHLVRSDTYAPLPTSHLASIGYGCFYNAGASTILVKYDGNDTPAMVIPPGGVALCPFPAGVSPWVALQDSDAAPSLLVGLICEAQPA